MAIGSLPEKCREIFEMAKFEGLTYDEIAEYLQVSVKTVENQMGIALKKLREAMVPYSKQVYET
jgi:RNA polymerase sigma-70 factor (ECF subfamily)